MDLMLSNKYNKTFNTNNYKIGMIRNTYWYEKKEYLMTDWIYSYEKKRNSNHQLWYFLKQNRLVVIKWAGINL